MTTISARDYREELLQLYHTRRTHEFLLRSDQYLAQVHGDTEIMLRTIQGYLSLGLVTPAQGHLDNLKDTGEFPPELAGVSSIVAGLAQGCEQASTLRQRFTANLQVLTGNARAGVDIELLQDAWSAVPDRLQVLLDHSDRRHIRYRGSTGQWRWFPFFGDHEVLEAERDLPGDVKEILPGPYAFDGVGTGIYFRRMYDATLDTFHGYSCPLYVVEPDPFWLAVALSLHDWSEVLADPRVMIFCGATCTNALSRMLTANSKAVLPTQLFRLNDVRPEPQPLLLDTIRQVAEFRASEQRRSFAFIQSRYAGRDAGWWARRMAEALSGDGQPLRVLSSVSIHTTFLQYSMRDVKAALETLGHQCRVLQESNHFEHIDPQTFHEAIESFAPDVYLSLDHVRPEFTRIIPDGLPVLTWDQDQLPQVITKKNADRMSNLDFFAGYGVRRMREFGLAPKQLLYSGIPTNPRRFDGPPLSPDELARYTCDVSYVSHASQTPKEFHDEERRNHDPSVRPLLDAMYEAAHDHLQRNISVHGAMIKAVIVDAMCNCGMSSIPEPLFLRLTDWYLWRLGDRVFRHEALRWAADWADRTGRTLRIYGKGWETHPELARFSAGPAENGRELLCIYRASRINLQLMPAGFIHQRSLDGLSAGGFFLTRMTHGDRCGKAMRAIADIIESEELASDGDLLNHPDEDVQRLLDQILVCYRNQVETAGRSLIDTVLATADIPSPSLIFDDFERIAFDSLSTFTASAERFLAGTEARCNISANMRKTVIDQFSYEATMRAFLLSHLASLESAAVQPPAR